MAKAVEAYGSLPTSIRKEVDTVAKTFDKDPNVRRRAEFLSDKHGVTNKRKARLIAAFETISTRKVITTGAIGNIHAFDLRGNTIKFTQGIKKGKHVALVRGEMSTTNRSRPFPVVVKYYKHGDEDITKEIKIYRELRNSGAPVPWISTGFFFWNSRVLVMEPLLPVTKEHDEFHLGYDVLDQLHWLHKCGIIHNDLKPLNVMVVDENADIPDDDVTLRPDNGGYKFRIIDMGGVATEILQHGYRREIWTPKWCCQKKGQRGQVTTAKHDLIELGYTMKTMQCWRTGEKQIRNKHTKKYEYDPYRNYFTGKLGRYMDRVNKIDEANITEQDYEDLDTILRSK